MKPAAPVTKTRIGCLRVPIPRAARAEATLRSRCQLLKAPAWGRFAPRLTLPETLVIEHPDQPKPFAALSHPTGRVSRTKSHGQYEIGEESHAPGNPPDRRQQGAADPSQGLRAQSGGGDCLRQ